LLAAISSIWAVLDACSLNIFLNNNEIMAAATIHFRYFHCSSATSPTYIVMASCYKPTNTGLLRIQSHAEHNFHHQHPSCKMPLKMHATSRNLDENEYMHCLIGTACHFAPVVLCLSRRVGPALFGINHRYIRWILRNDDIPTAPGR
jgi:hypothetical protein